MARTKRIDNGTVEGSGILELVPIMRINGIEKRFHRGLHLVSVFIDPITDQRLPDNAVTNRRNSIIGINRSIFFYIIQSSIILSIIKIRIVVVQWS